MPLNKQRYFGLLILYVLGTSQFTTGWSSPISDSTRISIDSILVVIDNDTLKYQQTHRINIPLFSPSNNNLDSVEQHAALSGKTKTNSGIAATGSISRGIQVSSNATVSLQSSMYLKIKGKLSDNYIVSGTLSEKTSPLQPIGNTRRLNDFDRVMIKISGPTMNTTVGDIDLNQRNGQFGKLDRSIEGIEFSFRSDLVSTHTALGFSYGKYRLQQIQGKDGKQGPYRLSGRNGEKFIIVLAGSEKVRVDDKQVQRGQDDDYIIDYNAAEITFTQKRILSSNSRISIEFEYVPDIYLASYSFGKQLISNNIKYGNKDSSSFYIAASWQELKDDDRNPLGNIEAGVLEDIFTELSDSVASTTLSSVQLDSLNGDYNLNTDGVLEYVGNGLGTHSASFSFVGLNTGTYRKILTSLDTYFVYDTLQGEYLPSQRYFAPKSKSVLTLETGASIGLINVNMEMGISRSINNLYALSSSVKPRKAWDIQMKSQGRGLDILIGDKQLESGFVTHDAIESIEYYRRWGLSQRISEAEHLNYGRIRLGETGANILESNASRFTRNGILVGQQIHIAAKTNPEAPLSVSYSSFLTDRDESLGQQHEFNSELGLSKTRVTLHLSMEDASSSNLYPSNNHIAAGAGASYAWSVDQKVTFNFDQRQDYRLAPDQGSVLVVENINLWRNKRKDWSTEYVFDKLFNSKGILRFKYREQQNDSSSTQRYYLGSLVFSGRQFDNRFRYQENLIIDEEHIPKYDYQYVEVDTGYGGYSFDPFVDDYIPIPGGRFIRQRVYSDIEEQVRKYENKTRLEFMSKTYGKRGKTGVKGRLSSEQRIKLKIDSNVRIQDQSLLALDMTLNIGRNKLLDKLNYSGKATENNSSLYNYGAEKNKFVFHELNGILSSSANSTAKLAMTYEKRQREVEYNSLATEQWISYRPSVEYIYTFSPKQKLIALMKYSQVKDQHSGEIYGEKFLVLDYKLKVRRRGRIDQKLALSRILADVEGIPYSVFSGRQPGDNLKYTLNSRYIFSSSFQVSLNYSFQRRGENGAEQFLRLEGRTRF